MPPPGLGRAEPDLEGVHHPILAGDRARSRVEAPRDRGAALFVDRVIAALGEGVEQHLDGRRVPKQRVIRLDDAATGQRVAQKDRDDGGLDEGRDLLEPR